MTNSRGYYASFPHTYILVCDPTVSDRKSIHSYVILRNVRFSSETPPLRKISVRYVRNIRSKNLTFAVVLRRYRMKVFMFFTKHVSTWQAKLLADLFPSLVGFVFISMSILMFESTGLLKTAGTTSRLSPKWVP